MAPTKQIYIVLYCIVFSLDARFSSQTCQIQFRLGPHYQSTAGEAHIASWTLPLAVFQGRCEAEKNGKGGRIAEKNNGEGEGTPTKGGGRVPHLAQSDATSGTTVGLARSRMIALQLYCVSDHGLRINTVNAAIFYFSLTKNDQMLTYGDGVDGKRGSVVGIVAGNHRQLVLIIFILVSDRKEHVDGAVSSRIHRQKSLLDVFWS